MNDVRSTSLASPLGSTGQPELRVRAAAYDPHDPFLGAGDALLLIVSRADLEAGDALIERVTALVEGDLSDLEPAAPSAVVRDPDRSRRTYVYPWGGRRRRLAAVALADGAGPAALRVQGHRFGAALKKSCQRLGVVLGPAWRHDPAALAALIEGIHYGNFGWSKYKTREPRRGLEEVTLLGAEAPAAADGIAAAIARAQAIGSAATLARGLTFEPPDRLYPESLAARAVELAAGLETVRCTAWPAERIRRERLHGLLAVGRGSARPVAQIEWVYEPPAGAERTIVLVGKGVTYDSGGLQDKGPHMNHMNRDMAGAAAVVAMMTAVDRLRPAVRIVGLAGAAENMAGPDAYKTDEVIVHRDGKTTLVGHTDAEGRLVLYDQLVYARQTYAPELIIDMATLTGAVRMALGTDTFGVMSNQPGLEARERLLSAARRAGEKAWPLPLSHDLPNTAYVVANYEKNFNEVMTGKVTDLDNDGDREFGAGSSKGGAFLAAAIDDQVPWLHLDVAYTAIDGPMGSPVPALCHLLLSSG